MRRKRVQTNDSQWNGNNELLHLILLPNIPLPIPFLLSAFYFHHFSSPSYSPDNHSSDTFFHTIHLSDIQRGLIPIASLGINAKCGLDGQGMNSDNFFG